MSFIVEVLLPSNHISAKHSTGLTVSAATHHFFIILPEAFSSDDKERNRLVCSFLFRNIDFFSLFCRPSNYINNIFVSKHSAMPCFSFKLPALLHWLDTFRLPKSVCSECSAVFALHLTRVFCGPRCYPDTSFHSVLHVNIFRLNRPCLFLFLSFLLENISTDMHQIVKDLLSFCKTSKKSTERFCEGSDKGFAVDIHVINYCPSTERFLERDVQKNFWPHPSHFAIGRIMNHLRDFPGSPYLHHFQEKVFCFFDCSFGICSSGLK